MTVFNYITIASSAAMIALILVQARGASLGAGFGGGAEVNTVRRGSDKSIFQLTIIIAVVFIGSIIAAVVV